MKTDRAKCLVVALFLAQLPGFALAAPPASQAKNYRISKTYTTLSFTATKWMVFKEEGMFQDFTGSLTYDPADPSACVIDVTVQSASLDTRNSTRDGVLRSDDFFDVAKYPTLSFRSVSIASTGADSLNVTGDLTIHGVTKRVTVPVRVIGARVMPGIGDFAGFETSFTIDRRDFGVLGTRWSGNKIAIDPAVAIHLIIGAVRE
ncbi:MAG TPA: YceI family protein [Candidatus Acidoferrales bacterium]|nr:YceI family protein [Candidatus Acidoferrales bacterium]